MTAHCAHVDHYADYCVFMKHLYGKGVPLMDRARWDAACNEPRKARILTEAEFDYSNFSEEQGDGPIY